MTDAAPPLLSVVICTFRRNGPLEALLRALAPLCAGRPVEVVVVYACWGDGRPTGLRMGLRPPEPDDLVRKAEDAARAKDLEREKAAQDRLRNEQERKIQESRERDEAEARRKAEDEARKAAEALAKERADRPAKARPRIEAPSPAVVIPLDDEDSGRGKRGGKAPKDDRGERAREAATRSRDTGERRRGKLTIASALGDDADRQRSLASVRRARERERERKMGGAGEREKVSIEVTLPETITLQDLAGRFRISADSARPPRSA